MTLREALVIIGNEEDGPDGVKVPQDSIDELLRRDMLFKGGAKGVDLTEHGEAVY